MYQIIYQINFCKGPFKNDVTTKIPSFRPPLRL